MSKIFIGTEGLTTMYLADILMPLPTETPGLPGSVLILASPNSPLPEGRYRR
jgi:hypothetical protein